MKQIRINNFKEKLYYEKLENGLSIYLVPLKNKNNYTFMMTTKYGGRDINFKINNELIKTPTGIAHFLEHKIFEKQENPFEFYQKTGTDVNASTSYDHTSYYILGNCEYEKNIIYLLNWLKNLNITEEQVEKEKGIILEEASMYKDNPDVILLEKIKKNVFKEDPYRNKVIGTDEDIKIITKEEVMCCYNSFYNPKNMFIISTGNFNPKKALKIIKKHTKGYKNQTQKIEKYYGNEPDKVYKTKEIIEMDIDIPRVAIAYKMNKNIFKKLGIDDFELDLYIQAIINIGFGLTSEIREKWLKEKLFINSSYRIIKTDKHYVLEFSAISKKPEELLENIKKYTKNIKTDEKSFERQKKIWISEEVKSIGNIHNIQYTILDDVLEYSDFIPNKIERIRKMDFKSLEKIKEVLEFKNKAILIIKPKSKI